ncbi:MAG: alkaline phosphatase family protein [Deltaproteobacteria bacterium]|nr:alkaline phosphatase family protein [Deltaproteobacteria bacterium]
MRVKTCVFIFILLFTALFSSNAHAYIGPGAGFAVAGSFLALFTALISALFILLTWPLRYLLRALRYRRVFALSKVRRVVIVGLDGMDYTLTQRFLSEGKLPNFALLRDRGAFKPLESTVPPISPVAWSSFQTGTNPGKHNIFDFLTRDRRSYAPRLSSTEIKAPTRWLRLGKYRFALGSADIRLLRKAVPFWKTLGQHGIFSSIIRVPITFPVEKFYGVQLAAMCAPDLRGTQGMFSFYTTASESEQVDEGGEIVRVKRQGNTIRADLIGPENPRLKEAQVMRCPFELSVVDATSARLRIGGRTVLLKQNEYSDWIEARFKAAFGATISGICRFLLLNVEPEIKLYVTPINIDPDKPAMPISHPPIYATYLSKRQGRFATLGLAEDSWALNQKLINDDQFLDQCHQSDDEREKMFFDSLDKVTRGLCVCVFDGTDRVQHTFWRQLDQTHPCHQGAYVPPEHSAIEEIYQRADALLGKVMARCEGNGSVLMVISDHGFNAFRRGVDLNYWLEQNGYLKLKENGRNRRNLSGVDWSQTRAFALGLTGIYLNLKNRESKGIVDPKSEAASLREEIARKLQELVDPKTNEPAVKRVYNAWKVYDGPFKNDAPDLIVGYHLGYRASWETAIGRVTDRLFHDNLKAWSGDHCIDHSLVPGIFFCNKKINDETPRLMDIGPTVLEMFGIKAPAHMDGRALSVALEKG